MADASEKPLSGKVFYVDRTVYGKIGELDRRQKYLDCIKALGGSISNEVIDSDIVLVHPGRAKLDATIVLASPIVSYWFIEDCSEEGKCLPISRYLVNVMTKRDGSIDRDKRDREVDLSSDHDGGSSESAVLSDVDAPVPTFLIAAKKPFSDDRACAWAYKFLQWYTMHSGPATDHQILRVASTLMATIVPQLNKCTFRGACDKNKRLETQALQNIRDAKAQAEQDKVASMNDNEIQRLVDEAATMYQQTLKSL